MPGLLCCSVSPMEWNEKVRRAERRLLFGDKAVPGSCLVTCLGYLDHEKSISHARAGMQ